MFLRVLRGRLDFFFNRFEFGDIAPEVLGDETENFFGGLGGVGAVVRAEMIGVRGSAGVMLPHYSALKVAEQFRVLEAIAPGRIDLGVGRAPGSDRLTAHALNPYSNAAEDFPQQVLDLQAWVTGSPLPANHPYAAISANPRGPSSPARHSSM